MYNCDITGNTSTGSGGGVLCSLGLLYLQDCNVLNNTAEGNGGGVVLSNSQLELHDSIVAGNSASTGGGVAIGVNVSGMIEKSLIIGNSAGMGGGVDCLEGSTIEFYQTTIAGNNANQGGGIQCETSASPLLHLSIIWGNCATRGSEAYLFPNSFLGANCCCIDISGVEGDGDFSHYDTITDDPQFCSPEPCSNAPTIAGNYYLNSTSPCAEGTGPCVNQVGALGVGCGEPTPVRHRTWGSIKLGE